MMSMEICSNISNTINTDLLKFKLLYFNTVGSFATLKSYIPLFMKQLGLKPNQVGVLLGANQIAGFCVALAVGFIVDKFRLRKTSLIVCSLLMLLSILWLAFAFSENVHESCDDIHVKFNRSFSLFCNMHPTCTDEQFIASDRSWLYKQGDVQTSFYKLCVFLLPFEVFIISIYSLIDVFTMNALEEEIHKLPYQRSFGALGFGSILFVASWITPTATAYYCGINVSNVNFTPMFVCLFVMVLLTVPLVVIIKPEEIQVNFDKTTNNETWVGIKEFCKNGRNATFMLAGGVLVGFIYGFKMAYAFWRIDDLGGTKRMLGFAVLFHGLAEFVTGLCASRLIQTLGCLKIVSFGAFMFAADCFGYAAMRNPNWTLLLQVLEGFAFFCTYILGLVYIAETTRPRCQAAVTFMFSSSYLCLGRSMGSGVGGLLTGEFGVEKAFYMMSALSAVITIILGTLDWLYRHKTDELESYQENTGGDQTALLVQKSGSTNDEEVVDYGT
ncbi:major facilitator superfamily domain-containing protein 6-like [Anneissia japonica]|uniref:major facilitator superfamily domain-containing protein 6-like n=1 Tax=Anneissia japonica TaxID=1529436 RepID=UPI001425B664|nr:major facilitator superfamily domain-containing protein 6-like [Anneissia japonica]